MKIFVYGTLMQGMPREDALSSSKFLGTGYIDGSLYDLGHYPALKQGGRRVFGELYNITRSTLDTLDQIEGFLEDQPEKSLYLRRNTTVYMDSNTGSYLAETYFYNLSINESEKVITGDYRAYLNCKMIL